MELNQEEVLYLLRKHVATLSGMLAEGNNVPRNVLMSGGGPENRGGLTRINELVAMLKDKPHEDYQGGE